LVFRMTEGKAALVSRRRCPFALRWGGRAGLGVDKVRRPAGEPLRRAEKGLHKLWAEWRMLVRGCRGDSTDRSVATTKRRGLVCLWRKTRPTKELVSRQGAAAAGTLFSLDPPSTPGISGEAGPAATAWREEKRGRRSPWGEGGKVLDGPGRSEKRGTRELGSGRSR